MKIILLKDVPKVGKRHDVKEVSPGFARNLLFSKNLAVEATPQALERINKQKANIEVEQKVQHDLLMKNLEDLAKVNIILSEKANEKGHLFAQVHKKEIVEAVKEQSGLSISEELILLEEPIKEVGSHSIKVGSGKKEVEFVVDIQALV